ncbi:MAG: NAD(P)/FAD-dependent oxidoreductase [Imperialibacter sp.]|uniref:NAD(P)/FAD-dependent oxidoreductase n=1 Tax=Imperialibacter sp. TaxID=2038411 RepID=UPI003A86C3CF
MEVDFLIIGQGLAGTTLAFELLGKGKKVMVMADSKQPCASKVAAGLYNPITGNRLVKTWKADSLFDIVESYYQSLESMLDVKFVHPIGIYRPFTSIDEQNDWMAKSADPQFSAYVVKVTSQPHDSQLFHDPYGGVHLRKAGFIDTTIFLEASKKYLQAKGCFTEEMFHEDNLSITNTGISYKDLKAGNLVLAQGVGAQRGNLFSWLPLHELKGEILEVSTSLGSNTIFNRGCFMLPAGNERWRVGSTYNWRQPDYLPTEQGKKEILEKLNHLYKGNVELTNHMVGIRPSTKDRRPFLGKHPAHENIHIFNGLGTKGVSLSPFFAREMADYLVGQKPLSREVSIERYFSLYFERNVG